MTKPIDLSAKKAGGSMREHKTQSADVKEVSNPAGGRPPAAGISSLAGTRTRQAVKPEIIEQVGLRLRGIYNDVLMQPIPDRFLDLLSKLEAGAQAPPQKTVRNTGSKRAPK